MSDIEKTEKKKWVLCVDPGSDKAGYAVLNYDLTHGELGVAFISEMHRIFARLCRDTDNPPQFIVMGNGTACGILCKLFNSLNLDIPIRLADEKNTTYNARIRYFQENPPKGLWKIVPMGLRFPPRPIDDYAALLIGEGYLKDSNLVEENK